MSRRIEAVPDHGEGRCARRPVIGLTAYVTPAVWGVWDAEATLVPQAYVARVADAGGLPVVLPALPDLIAQVLERLDGLIICGGPDVDPAAYGEQPGLHTQPPSAARDLAESQLLAAATGRMPVLGICRGAQVLNVVRGGTLIQHLPDVVGTHLHCRAPGEFTEHAVRVAAHSRLAQVLVGYGTDPGGPGEPLSVPTYHHQAVDRLGAGLIASAWADDGVIEAIEDPALPFCLGVQWHPEVGSDPALFRGLVAAANCPEPAERAGVPAAGA